MSGYERVLLDHIQHHAMSDYERVLLDHIQHHAMSGYEKVLLDHIQHHAMSGYEEHSWITFNTMLCQTIRVLLDHIQHHAMSSYERVLLDHIQHHAMSAFPFTDFYVGTKFAIEGIAGSMAPLLRHYNIFVTCVEPGPVQTSITTNISKNNQGGITERDEVDVDAGVDDFARNQRKKFVATFVPFMQQIMQTGEDVGQVIKNCICSEKPSLRVQTSDAMKQRAKAVLVDPSGDKMTDELEKLLQ
ncbi:hypothetical protein BSL78_04306 [Apostichopus japonicus]|uniref:Uncharacterized protein n=1 Tax=Stichopus japonicus TaxID=307972 RepID=A0A2G8LEX2_STIJA|nr:hypothetical protein BSL78_04306 [Apostichopus japonicus]